MEGAAYESARYLVEEFAEEFRLGRLSRRDLLRRVLLITGSTAVTANALLALGCGTSNNKAAAPAATAAAARVATAATTAVAPSPAGTLAAAQAPVATAAPAALGAATMPPAQQSSQPVVSETDPAIQAGRIQFSGQAGTVFGYLARPRAASTAPALIVVPENMGLVEPNMDIARRFAKEGYIALAVDTVSRAGGTDQFAQDPAQIPAALAKLAVADVVADLRSGLAYLQTLAGVQQSGFGVTGFCLGGNYTLALASAAPEIRAAVPYYGMANIADLAQSRAAFLLFYGAEDTRVTSQAPAVEAALKQAGRPVEEHIEPGAGHAFFANTRSSYNPAAARDAWPRTLAWFATYLRS